MSKRCVHCGKAVSDEAEFCRYCGNRIEAGIGANYKPIQRGEEQPPVVRPPESTPKKSSGMIIIVLVVAIVAMAAAAVFIMGTANHRASSNETANETNEAANETGETANETDESAGETGNENNDSQMPATRKQTVLALRANASSQHKDMGDISYDPNNAIDNDLSTAWVEGVKGEGKGEWISVTFDNQGPICALRIRNGYQKSEEAYKTNNRVRTALVGFEDGSVEQFTLQDLNNTEQIVVLSEEKWGNTVTISIQSAYLSHDDNDTCITEIGALESGMDYPSYAEVVYAEPY